MAGPSSRSLTRSATWAFTVAQSSPTAAAPISRLPTAVAYDGATAVSADDPASTSIPTAITVGRSNRRVSRTRGKLATTTRAAHTDTSWAVRASLTPSPRLIGASTAVGSISVVTITQVAAPSTIRLGQGSRSLRSRSGRLVLREVVEVMAPTLEFDISVNVKPEDGLGEDR